MNKLNEIIEAIKSAQRIGISCHTSPDGDSLGSALALLQILRSIGKDAYIMSKECIPDSFLFLPYSCEFSEMDPNVKSGTHAVVILDCGNVERINADINCNSKTYSVINIDHHKSNELYGDLNYVDTAAAAVGEIIYSIMLELGVNLIADIAMCIYTSLVTDTGSFKFSNTTLRTHEIAGKMISTGIDFSKMHRLLFENRSYGKIKLYGKVIDGLELMFHDKIAILTLKQCYIDELMLKNEDSSDIIDFGMKIGTVEMAVLLKENEDMTKVSLRSKEYIDVRSIAEHFGGGGHTRASGFATYMDIATTKKKLLEIIKEYLNETT